MGRFDVLSDLDFEELVADLLRADTGLPFRAGVRGRDRGIDVLAIDSTARHVGQCKHLRTGGGSRAVAEARKETAKLAKIKPKPRWASYRFITSMPLSHDRRDEIAEILSRWVASSDDVLAGNDLERMLREHSEVEARHVKLWLAGAGALRGALHAGAYARSEALLEETRAALPRYVQTQAFLEAREILHEHGVVVIAGPPGVGKTTLARLLMLDGLEGGHRPYDIPQGGLAEAWDLLSAGERQLFFYDDFLGRISLRTGQEDDEKLMRFMRRVANAKSARVVLTTREYILRQAQRLSDVLERESSDLHRFVLHVDSYERNEKARIFYNHIYFSEQVGAAARRALLKDKAYRRIIDHRNYSPRLIEWMTGLVGDGLDDGARSDYARYCLDVLQNPDRLWQRAFDRGLDEADRALLLCVASLPDRIELPQLQRAFVAACKARGVPSHGNQFITSLKILDDSFVATIRQGDVDYVRLHNPSLLDFLTEYLRSSVADAELVLDGAAFLEQVLWVWDALSERGKPASWSSRMVAIGPPPSATMPAFGRAFESTLEAPDLELESGTMKSLLARARMGQLASRLDLLTVYMDRAPGLRPFVRPWLGRYAEAWAERLPEEPITVRGLELVEHLARHDALDAEAVIGTLKSSILAMDDRQIRWAAIAASHRAAPSVFGDDEWAKLRAGMDRDLTGMLDDAAAYFEEVSELEDFAGIAMTMGLEVDGDMLSSAIEDVEIAIAERQDEEDEEDEPDYDAEDFRELRGGGDDDADIDAMFERFAD